MTDKPTHGGRRTPGPGKRLGRPPRGEPVAHRIWCGQISDEDRRRILDALTPEERFAALMAAVEAKEAAQAVTG